MSQEWNIPCCGAHFQNISTAQSSPVVQIQTPCTGSPLLLPNHSASLCHLSITQHLSTLLSSHFFLEASSQGMQTLLGLFLLAFWAWHSSPLPALNYQTSNYYRSKWQKTLCIQPAKRHLFQLPVKFFRACDKPVVSSHFWMMHSHKNWAPTASITHRNKTKSHFKKNLVCKNQGK